MMFKFGLITILIVTQCIAVETTNETNSTTSSANQQHQQVENMNAYDKTLHFFGKIADDAKDVYSNIVQDHK